MDYNLSGLANFVQIANLSTLTEGAKKLKISQPSLTESIKKLEKSLGVILFYRSKSGIRLTPDGRILLLKGKKLLSEYEDIKNIQDEKTNELQNKILIGAHSTVAQYIFPSILGRIKKDNVISNIEFIHDLSRNIQEKVQKGEIDLAIVINPRDMPDLIIKEIATDNFGFFEIRQSKRNIQNPTIICNFDLFQTNELLKKSKLKLDSIIETSSLELIARMVDSGVGIGLMPERVARLISDKLILNENLPILKDRIALVYRPEIIKNKNFKLILESIKNSF